MAKKKNINDMGIDELRVELKNLNDSLFNFNFQKALQQLEDGTLISKTKKEIAQIKTVLNEFNLGIRSEEGAK